MKLRDALTNYAKKQYYDLKAVPGGKKANLTEIIAITMRKRLKHLNYKGEDPVRAEITLGFDGAGSYQEFGRKHNPDQKNQIFGEYSVLNLNIPFLILNKIEILIHVGSPILISRKI